MMLGHTSMTIKPTLSILIHVWLQNCSGYLVLMSIFSWSFNFENSIFILQNMFQSIHTSSSVA